MLAVALLLLEISIGIVWHSYSIPPIVRLLETGSVVLASAPQNNNSITGHIFDNSHRPIAQVYVELQDDFYSTIGRPIRTDGSGSYAFTGLQYGVYNVIVRTYGTDYIGQTQRVQIDSLSRSGRSSQSLQVDFTLSTKRESNPAVSVQPGAIFVQEIPDAAHKIYDEAIKDLNNGERADIGLNGLKKAISIFPNYYLALERLGTEYVKRQQYKAARDVLIKAVEVNPRGDKSLYSLGIAHFALKETSQAIESLSRAVSFSPNSINYQMWLGKALWANVRLDESENHFKQAYLLGGKRIPIVHVYLAQIYDRQGRYREEADELELYLAEEPNPDHKEKIKEAIKSLRKKAKSD